MNVEIMAGLITFAILMGIVLLTVLFRGLPSIMGDFLFYGLITTVTVCTIIVTYNGYYFL